jgi:hypothetical protein
MSRPGPASRIDAERTDNLTGCAVFAPIGGPLHSEPIELL